MLTVTGYVSGDPVAKEGDYGRYTEISLRWKTSNGKQTHYANAKVYGKKIDVVCNYIHDGDQVTISGAVSAIMSKQRKDGTDYCQIYMDCAEFSIPAKPSAGGGTSSPGSRRSSQSEEEEVPF
jgi:single-stranded DNA-binding protein